MRLDRLVADAGAMTRREARKMIKNGKVTADGVCMRDIAAHVSESAVITVEGEKKEYSEFIYIMLNKPSGYISATEDGRQKTVLDLIDPSYRRYSLFPAGRLDIDTEGFLLLTNDGKFAHDILSPSKKVGKTYFVRCENDISDADIAMLCSGVDIGECITKPAYVKRVSKNEIELTITEGKFHQIKRMLISIGNSVIYLKRLAYGNLSLDNSLRPGEYKKLYKEDIELIIEN